MRSSHSSGLRYIRATYVTSCGIRLDSYEIVVPLGAGGMGEVYRARDATLKRDVAIKVLPEFWSRDPERLHRFDLEAQAAAALNHLNIVSIFHVGQYNGSPYIVTELLYGETLRERLRPGPMRVEPEKSSPVDRSCWVHTDQRRPGRFPCVHPRSQHGRDLRTHREVAVTALKLRTVLP